MSLRRAEIGPGLRVRCQVCCSCCAGRVESSEIRQRRQPNRGSSDSLPTDAAAAPIGVFDVRPPRSWRLSPIRCPDPIGVWRRLRLRLHFDFIFNLNLDLIFSIPSVIPAVITLPNGLPFFLHLPLFNFSYFSLPFDLSFPPHPPIHHFRRFRSHTISSITISTTSSSPDE